MGSIASGIIRMKGTRPGEFCDVKLEDGKEPELIGGDKDTCLPILRRARETLNRV